MPSDELSKSFDSNRYSSSILRAVDHAVRVSFEHRGEYDKLWPWVVGGICRLG